MCGGRCHKQHGFTLLEIMIALAVLSVALVALLKSGGENLSLLYESNTLTTVSMLARQKLSELESTFGSSTAMEGDFGEKFPEYRWKADIVPTPSALGNARKLRITVSWVEGKREKNFVLSQFVSFEQ